MIKVKIEETPTIKASVIDNDQIVKASLDIGTPIINREGGTDDYNILINKPKLNNIELVDNKSLTDLGIVESELTNIEIDKIFERLV